MVRSVGVHDRTSPSRVARHRWTGASARWLTALLLLLAAATPLAAQQDGRPTPSPGDTVADTVPADTALTVRERALRRLRAMPIDPVEPDPADTLAADSLAADSLAADSLAADSLAADSLAADSLALDTLAAPAAGDPAGARPGEEADAADEERPAADSAGAEPGPVVAADTAREAGDPAVPVEVEDTLIPFADDTLADRVLTVDSVLAAIQALEGWSQTRYEGERAVFRADSNQLELTGASRVAQGESALETDSLLVYDGGRGVVCGYGTPVLSGEADPIESDELCFNIRGNIGVAVGARTTFQQGGTWYVRGAENRVYVLTGGEKKAIYGEATEFTSCDLDHPHYSFRARSVKMVEDETMVARDITLRFADVPVFWLPWMVQSMKQGRRSGLLMPEFGVNDIVRNSTGYNRHLSNIGFYWAMNDYMSAKGTFEWFSGNWTAVEGALTYRWLRQFLSGSVTAKRYWRESGEGDFTLNTSNSWEPDERTRVQANANYATSTDFVRDNSFDPRELNRSITSSASVSRRFDWGSLSLGAQHRQQLSTGQEDLKLPGASLNISPVTIFDNGDGLSLTWSGSGNYNRQTRSFPNPIDGQDNERVNASYNHRINFGKLGVSQNVDWSDEFTAERSYLVPLADSLAEEESDSVVFDPSSSSQRLSWSSSVSYQQVLWPGTTVSPNVSIRGNRVRDDETGGTFVEEPNRVSAGASLNTAIYGFWPGFGRFSRIRHKIAPSLSWSYSPAPSVTPLQDSIFGLRNLQEENRLSLNFNQTFEAKVREDEVPDSAAADSLAADSAGPGRPGDRGEPRRLPQAEKVLLLSLDTRTSFVYDFVAAREEGRGFLTREITNSIRSDLLRGLQITMTHDLFEGDERTVPDSVPLPERTFSPFLTSLQASFSIDHNFWLFDVLGLTRSGLGPGESEPFPDEDVEGVANVDDPQVGAEAEPGDGAGMGSMIPGAGADDRRSRPGVGGWRASLNYQMSRRRPVPGEPAPIGDNQLLSGNFSFDPTQHWSVTWSTAYSFTEGEFANHVLTLTRDLHRWRANFDFIKAQNGNFALQFRVELRDNPDLKLDYDQRTDPSDRGRQP